ncbi:class I SAM-dependent methyltransferase [Shewanella baltica]|uniref:Class I SAM-dependent methyltransferase n=1 Tax=Shewanella septentrionalis TaxID=2952223 RepID=A0A9X2WYB3_9GAMM|nr:MULTISPECIES: class I SAM-dependent methyltransferase [Shewanella]MCS6154737.1 class I SAM-dependent methyltransferase [Shewanella baltica]MCS6174468.1 class I SAM-dependent methyltransferase [Shewanella baltica]MCT7947676.1 class I SAM-dependent methyltransferase [Shewanella septentrionalis]
MKLNPFEKKLVQHPIRFWLQNHVEAPLLTSMMPKPMARCERALEIGCGFGNGIQLIREHFGAGHITAVDIDPEMVAAAQSRWQARPQGLKGLSFSVADASRLPFADGEFDMVFDFAVFHHIPDWQAAIKDVARVLKPNGYFVIEDLYRAAICNPLSRRLFEHPQQNRFNHRELLLVLRQAGFEIVCDRNALDLAGMVLAQKVQR